MPSTNHSIRFPEFIIHLGSNRDNFVAQNPLKVVATTFLLVCYSSLKENTYEIWKNVFYFTLRALFLLKKITF